MKRFAVLLGVLSLAVGSVGCSQLPDHDRYKVEISQADREKLAEGPPPEDFHVNLKPNVISALSKFHGICELMGIQKPSTEGVTLGEYVPLNFECTQGNLPKDFTGMFVPWWSGEDEILRLQPGQVLLLSVEKNSSHYATAGTWEIFNIYSLSNDGTLSIMNADGTKVGNLKEFAAAFGLADYKPN
jgi:hypothetical protein